MNETPDNPASSLPSVSSGLLEGVRQMQPESWARLVEVFSPIVYRWARQSGVQQADAADVVQDVFISVANHVSGFQRQKEQGSFRSWLATIARNRIRDSFRRRDRHPVGRGGTGALQQLNDVQQPDLADKLDQTITVADLDQRVPHQVLQLVRAECDPPTWEAFWATTVLGDAAGDVAARLEMSVASVYQAKSRILRRIRKRLEELPE